VRARHVGLIVPSSNTSTELDFAAWAPPGLALHAARMHMVEATLAAAEAFVADGAPRAARDLRTLEPDAVVFACTAAGAVLGDAGEAAFVADLARIAGAPVVSTNAACAEEIAAHAPRRIAILTPYLPDITAGIVAARTRAGYEVVRAAGMEIALNRDIGRVTPGELEAFARRELAGHAFDLLFISCTNLRTGGALGRLREHFGVPVVSSNGASLRATLRQVGLEPAELD
jgi:maleate isomerase